MTELQSRKAEEKARTHKAFGEERTGQEWAKQIGISFGDFFYYVTAKNMTIEEIYDHLGIAHKKRERGRYMQHTRDTIETLLLSSGYIELEGLKIEPFPGRPVHRIFLDGDPVGQFHYKEDRLVLTSGEGFYMADFGDEDVLIVKRGSVWEWHEDTRRAARKRSGL